MSRRGGEPTFGSPPAVLDGEPVERPRGPAASGPVDRPALVAEATAKAEAPISRTLLQIRRLGETRFFLIDSSAWARVHSARSHSWPRQKMSTQPSTFRRPPRSSSEP